MLPLDFTRGADGRLETIIRHSCQKKHMTVTQPANTQQTDHAFK